MGHIRLGTLPRTKQWEEVVALAGGMASAPALAAAVLDAADERFASAASDAALQQIFHLAVQFPTLAAEENFTEALYREGIRVSANPTPAEFTRALSDAIDDRLLSARTRSGIGEIAQQALESAVAEVLRPAKPDLFGQRAAIGPLLADLAKEKPFGQFARHFFSEFSRQYLSYFLDRELPLHVNGQAPRFGSVQELQSYESELRRHCYQVARIVEDFAGGWYDKAAREHDLSRARTTRFLGYAFTKLRAELRRGSAA